MLLPTQLKAPEYAFIEEEDIGDDFLLRTSQVGGLPKAPLTGYQQERLDKHDREEEQAKEDAISDEERERTIRCLMKVMNYQLDGVGG